MDQESVRYRRLWLIFFCSILFLFIFLLAMTKIANYDVWWHLATGRHILLEGFPETDPFNYTHPEVPPYLQSWLAGVLFYLAWKAGGPAGLTVLKGLLTVLLFALLWSYARIGAGEKKAFYAVTAVAIIVSALGIKFRLLLRPQLMELILLAAALVILKKYRWRFFPMIPALALLQLIWVNSHMSYVVGIALPVIFLCGDAIDALLGERDVALRRALGVTGLLLLLLPGVSFINPGGYRGMWLPFEQLGRGTYMMNIGEWMPLKAGHFKGLMLGYMWGFAVMAILGFAVLAGRIILRRRPPASEIILFLLFVAIPFWGGIRFTAEFLVISCPIVASWILGIIPSHEKGASLWHGAEVLVALALLPIWWLAIARNPIYEAGLGEKPGKFPRQAVEFIRAVQPAGRIFNSYGYGGYLMWHLPEFKVFIDGRAIMYSSEFYNRYVDSHRDESIWKELENEYNPSIVVLFYTNDIARKERIVHLENNPEWALVFWDPTSLVYLKREAANQELIERYEYRIAKPAYFKLDGVDTIIRNPEVQFPAIREYRRAIGENDSNAEAYQALAAILAFGRVQDQEAALDAVRKALGIDPRLHKAYAIACMVHTSREELDAAAKMCRLAARLNPDDVFVRQAVQRLESARSARM